jgi:hypothetical protein
MDELDRISRRLAKKVRTFIVLRDRDITYSTVSSALRGLGNGDVSAETTDAEIDEAATAFAKDEGSNVVEEAVAALISTANEDEEIRRLLQDLLMHVLDETFAEDNVAYDLRNMAKDVLREERADRKRRESE